MQEENKELEAIQEPVALDSHAETDSVAAEDDAQILSEDASEDTSEDTAGFDPSAMVVEVDAQADDNPDDIVEPDPPLPDYTFEQASDTMKEAMAKQGWTSPMLVQRKAIPYLLAGQDLITQSRTGSGKTGAFMIPLVEICELEHPEPQALILVPTRELALQVAREAELIGAAKGVNTVVVYGGVGYEKQIEGLKKAHIVIGTPGRVIDMIQKGYFKLRSIRDLVMDEADEMLSMGFYPDMARIRQMLPKDRCTYMFSATITENVKHLAREFLRNPKFLSLSQKKRSVDAISHRYMVVDKLAKDKAVFDILEHDHPEMAFIFCNTKRDVAYLSDYLRSWGLSAEPFSGDMSQVAREKVMARFRKRETRYMVTTDVAARGIDISDIPCVIQYELPMEPDVYVHRAGRTARAGKTGVAWTVVSELEELGVKAIGRRFDLRFEKVAAAKPESAGAILLERCVGLLERADRDSSRAVRRGAEKLEKLIPELLESESTRMGLALLISKAYREEFYGQKDASLAGQEMAKIGVEEDGEERHHGGGGRHHGGSSSHGGGRPGGGGGRFGGGSGGPRRRR
ncbi:MAG: DEAD/DEAH box helicase [Fibrobacterota bacterium]|nr:MAG: DEAD/DEAH box helicase [Fibrobacterota bacterium]